MKSAIRFHLVVILAGLIPASSAMAHHVVWLDYGRFNLSGWTGTGGVNGNDPATAADVAAIQAQLIANVVEDYAPFDVYFTTFRPPNGRYTRVRFLAGADPSGSNFLGCASCCASCTGIGSWKTDDVSWCEIYLGEIAGSTSVRGANATTARVADRIGLAVSHEVGHLLGLGHFNGADDSFSAGCSSDADCPGLTGDQVLDWHIMSFSRAWSGNALSPASISGTESATRDFFFSPHSERRILYGAVQARNHWSPLPNLNAGFNWVDLAYGRLMSPSTVEWYGRLSLGASFGDYSTWRTDGGDAGDIFLLGDVDGDRRSDLVYGRIVSATQVRWYVRLSEGDSFGGYSVWRSDGGDPGDIFRLADVNGDRRADLVYGRPLEADTVRWYVRLSTGAGFGDYSTWRGDAGDEGDVFLLGDVDDDGDADLVYGRTVSETRVTWYVRRSNGAGFGALETWREDAGDEGDLFYLADVGGDGDADLVYARIYSDGRVTWYVRFAEGDSFGDLETWETDAGDAGDLFRLGDGNGDGFVDLFYGRPVGMTSLTTAPDLSRVRWYGRPSLSWSFGDYSTWRSDAGDEGDIFP